MAKKEVVSRLVPTKRMTKKKEVEETPAEKKKETTYLFRKIWRKSYQTIVWGRN